MDELTCLERMFQCLSELQSCGVQYRSKLNIHGTYRVVNRVTSCRTVVGSRVSVTGSGVTNTVLGSIRS